MPKKSAKHAEEVEDVEQVEEDLPKVHYSEFDLKRLYFKATDNTQSSKQLMCYPKYMYDDHPLTTENFEKYGKSVIIVTDPIKFSKGGIPRYNPEYHGTDVDSMKRAYFYIPNNETSEGLFEKIKEIDDYMIEEINVKKNANKVLCVLQRSDNKKDAPKRLKISGITYVPIISVAKPADTLIVEEDDDEDTGKSKKKSAKNAKEEKKEFVPWERIKVRLSTLYDENLGDNDKRDINTQIFVGDKEEPENCTTVSQIEKEFMWNCTAQAALMLSKAWIMKTEDKKCSITVKCLQLGITEQPEFRSSTSITKQLSKSLFSKSAPLKITKDSNSDDEEEEITSKSTKSSSNKNSKSATPVKGKKQVVQEEEDDESEEEEENSDESEEENEEEEENEDESEPESEPEEEEPPAKTSKGKAGIKVKGKETPDVSTSKKAPTKKGK